MGNYSVLYCEKCDWFMSEIDGPDWECLNCGNEELVEKVI